MSDDLKPKLEMAEAIRRRWGDDTEGWNPSIRHAHNDILDLLDVIDALDAVRSAWPQGDEAAQQLGSLLYDGRQWALSLSYLGGTEEELQLQTDIRTAEYVLARLNGGAE